MEGSKPKIEDIHRFQVYLITTPLQGDGGSVAPGMEEVGTRKALLGKEGRKMSNDFEVFLFGAYVFRRSIYKYTCSINILSIPHIYTVYIYYY